MKNFVFFIFLIFVSCAIPTSKFTINDRKKETYLIVDEIIKEDKINVLKEVSKNKIIQFMKKPELGFSSNKNFENAFAPTDHTGRSNKNLLNLGSERTFDSSDYKYVLYQYKNNDSLEINSDQKNTYNFTTLQNAIDDKRNSNSYDYYEFTIPYFSRDHTTAYIEMNYQSGSMYGDGTAYLLKKKNNKWKIVGRWGTWIT